MGGISKPRVRKITLCLGDGFTNKYYPLWAFFIILPSIMKQNIFELGAIIRTTLPYVMAVLGTFISVIQMPAPTLGLIRPDILLIFVYFWAVHRPDFFPIALIFLTTLTVDLIHGPAVGLGPIIHIVIFEIVKRQRRFLLAQSFLIQWLCFCLLCFVKFVIEWLVISSMSVEVLAIYDYLALLGFSCVFYPFISFILMYIHRYLGKE